MIKLIFFFHLLKKNAYSIFKYTENKFTKS